MAAKKERVFRSSLKAIWGLLAVAVPVCAGLGYMAWWGNRIAPPELNDPSMRILCFYLPVLILVLLLSGLGLLAFLSRGKSFTISPEGLTYQQGNYTFSARWADVVIVRPPPDQKGLFLMTLISDGKHFARIEKYLFPEYDLLVSVIEAGRDAKRGDYSV